MWFGIMPGWNGAWAASKGGPEEKGKRGPCWGVLKAYGPGFWEAYIGRAGLFMIVQRWVIGRELRIS